MSSQPDPKFPPSGKGKIFYGWWVVLACAIVGFYTGGAFFYGFTAFFIPISSTFGWSYATIALASSIRSMESGAFSPITGFLTDKFGPRKVMFCGALILGWSAILFSHINSLPTFYLAYLGVSLGMSACIGVVPLTAVANWFRAKIGSATALLVTGFAAGGFMAPVIVWFIAQYDWRTTMLILGIGTWILCLPLTLIVRHKPEQYGYSIDGDRAPVQFPSRTTESETAEFVKATERESTHTVDFTVREALRTRTFWVLISVLIANSLAVSAIMLHMLPYMDSIQITEQTASFIIPLVTGSSIAGRLLLGWLADRVDKRYILVTACILRTIGVFVFTYAQSLPWLILFAITFGPGYGSIVVMRIAVAREYFGRRSIGTIQGFMMGIMTLGSMVGPWLAGYIFDINGDYQIAWLAIAIVSMIVIPLPLLIKPLRKASHTP
ncbi:MFS transporter [Chloroflexota bacterium]